MPKIIEELCRVSYLNQLIIGLDCATQEEYARALGVFSQLPQNTKVLWNDGPRLKALDQKLRSAKALAGPDGEGQKRLVLYGICVGL